MPIERSLELSHGKTRYFESGSGDPVIFLHGSAFPNNADYWMASIDVVGEHYWTLAPDFLGWGPSDRLKGAYSFAYLVDFVREFQDALGIRRAHIVGQSMGGWVASLLAYESPNRVDKLVLSTPGGVESRPLASMVDFEAPTLDELRSLLRHMTPLWSEAEVEERAQSAFAVTTIPGAVENFRAVMDHMSDPETRLRYNTVRRLPYIEAPTLLIWGGSDSINPPAMAQKTHSLIKGSQLEVIQSEHFVPLERPDEFNRLILEFLHASRD